MTLLRNTWSWPPLNPRHWPERIFKDCNCPAELRKRRRHRAGQVVERLCGTMQGLNSELDEWEQNDLVLLEMISEELFECEGCGWWCIRDEQSDCDGEFCEDCRP